MLLDEKNWLARKVEVSSGVASTPWPSTSLPKLRRLPKPRLMGGEKVWLMGGEVKVCPMGGGEEKLCVFDPKKVPGMGNVPEREFGT